METRRELTAKRERRAEFVLVRMSLFGWSVAPDSVQGLNAGSLDPDRGCPRMQKLQVEADVAGKSSSPPSPWPVRLFEDDGKKCD